MMLDAVAVHDAIRLVAIGKGGRNGGSLVHVFGFKAVEQAEDTVRLVKVVIHWSCMSTTRKAVVLIETYLC